MLDVRDARYYLLLLQLLTQSSDFPTTLVPPADSGLLETAAPFGHELADGRQELIDIRCARILREETGPAP